MLVQVSVDAVQVIAQVRFKFAYLSTRKYEILDKIWRVHIDSMMLELVPP
jgi:hypothetical protein